MAGASKQTALGENAAEQSAFPFPTLYYALEAFLANCAEMSAAVEDFKAAFDANDKAALAQFLTTSLRRPTVTDANATSAARTSVFQNAPKFDVGYAATVLAIKANEAVTRGERIELKKEWFELA